MQLQERESEVLFWQTPEHSFTIETPWALLEEIHAHVQEGFRKLSRGGVEVGGVLFGRRTDTTVRVLGWRPIACEHARGAAFLLSNNDTQSLVNLLESAAGDPQLKVLEPVGWFVSHTRTPVALTEEDVDIFNRHFSEPWQCTLVYHPRRQDPTRAGFFLRERDGQIHTAGSHREFIIDGARAVRPQPLSNPGVVASQPAATRSSRSFFRWIWAAVPLLAVAIALSALPKLRQAPPSVEPVQLRLKDAKGQLLIEWDRESAAIRQAEGATLFISDGGALPSIELDAETTRRGSVTYARLSEDVTVRLQLKRKNQPPVTELARYVGPPVPKIETQELRQAREGRENRISEALRLQDELKKQSERTRRLERAVKRLEAQIKRGSKKR